MNAPVIKANDDRLMLLLSAERPAVQQRTPRSPSSVPRPRGAAGAARGVAAGIAFERTRVAFGCCNGLLGVVNKFADEIHRGQGGEHPPEDIPRAAPNVTVEAEVLPRRHEYFSVISVVGHESHFGVASREQEVVPASQVQTVAFLDLKADKNPRCELIRDLAEGKCGFQKQLLHACTPNDLPFSSERQGRLQA